MKKLALLFLFFAVPAIAQTAARFDAPPLSTVPAGDTSGLPPMYAIPNATISVCSYPASGNPCTNKITTYTDSTLTTACPSSSQITQAGSSICTVKTDSQGNFGFWYNATANAHLQYTVQTTWGNFGPFDIMNPGAQVCGLSDCAMKLPRVDARNSDFAGGADPTGAKDSTAAFQAAIDFAVAQESSHVGNPAVYCAPGTYKINGTLKLPDYINFVGDGRSTCTLTETNATANLITVGAAAVSNPTSGSIRNLTLQGSGSSTTGTLLEVDNTPGYTLENVQLVNNGGRGLQLNGHSERLSSHNLRIDFVRWPIVMPADENESYFVNTQITYPGDAYGYCYSINCVNGVAPGPNQGSGGAATPISPDTHAAIYVDDAVNFRFLGGSIKPLGHAVGIQDFNSEVGTVDSFYFEGLYDQPWASDSPAIAVGGAAPMTTLSASLSGTGTTVAVASTDWQPEFYEDTSQMPTSGDEDGVIYVLMPADYLAGSTQASADVPGVQRGQFEKVTIEGFAGDGNLHIYQRNIGGSTAPAGTVWTIGTVVEEVPQPFGGYGAVTIASDHFHSQETASSGYAKNCNQLNTLTCAEIVAGYEPDGYWIDPSGGPNSNLTAKLVLNNDAMFSSSDQYFGQIATHDTAYITIEGYAALTGPETSEVVTSPFKYNISPSLGGSYITVPTYGTGVAANVNVVNASNHSDWSPATRIYSGDAAIYGQGIGSTYMQGKQYAGSYCLFDTPSSGAQPTNRFCLVGGPENTSNAGWEYDIWNGTAWVLGVSPSASINSLIVGDGNAATAQFQMSPLGVATSTQNYPSAPLTYDWNQWISGASSLCHARTGIGTDGKFGWAAQIGDSASCAPITVILPIASQILTNGGTANVAGVLGTPTPGHLAVFDTHGYLYDGGAVPAGSTIAATSPITATTSGGTTTIACPTCGSGGGGVSTVSVVSANGLAGTVANPTTTPAITLSTTINGLLKGNGTGISAATAGTDYLLPSGNAATATALAATPTGCSGSQFSQGISANGNANCATPSGGSSGISGLTAGYIPLAGSSTTLTGNSHLDDGVTAAGIITSTEPISFSGASNGSIGLKSTGTLPSAAATSTVQLTVPNAVTAYTLELPGANPTSGNTFLSCTAANPSVCSWTAGGSGGAVSSVFGRTGVVVAASGDYTAAQVTNAASTATTSQQNFAGNISTPSINGVFQLDNFVKLDPTGCTVGGTAYTTPLECAVATADAYDTANSTCSTLKLGPGTFNTVGQLLIPNRSATNCTLSIEGAGRSATQINLTGTISSGGVIEHPAGSLNRFHVRNLRVNANYNAPYAIDMNSAIYADVSDVIVSGANTADLEWPSGSNTFTTYDVFAIQSGSVSQGKHAYFIPTVASGAVTALTPAAPVISVNVVGGSGYTNPSIAVAGGNCSVVPQFSISESGGSVSVSVSQGGMCESAPTLTISDPNGTGATATPVLQAFGGSGYTPANTKIYFFGTGAATAPDQPCDTLPVYAPTFSGSTITGATDTSSGSGCISSSLYVQVIDAAPTLYGIDIGGTDSVVIGGGEEEGIVAGLNITGDGTKVFGNHPYYVPVGIRNTAGQTKLIGVELDSPRHYGIETSFILQQTDTQIGWDGDGPYPGASFMHITSSQARNFHISDLSCGNSQYGGGFNDFVDYGLGAVTAQNPTLKLNGQAIAECSPGNPIGTQDYVNTQSIARQQFVDTSAAPYYHITLEAPALTGNQTVTLPSTGGTLCTTATCTGGSMVYPAAGIGVSTGTAWGSSLTAPTGAIVGTTDTQTLTNKSIAASEVNSGTLAAGQLPAATPTVAGAVVSIANIQITTTTTALSANTCEATAHTATMTGLLTTSTLNYTPTSDTSGVAGWGSTGGLFIDGVPTAGAVSWKVCNPTSAAITPGAVTWNVSAR